MAKPKYDVSTSEYYENPACYEFYVEGLAKYILEGVNGTESLPTRCTLDMMYQGYQRAKAQFLKERRDGKAS